MQHQWTPIPGFNGVYEIQRGGSIRLSPTVTDNPYRRKHPGDLITPHTSGGYWVVNLRKPPHWNYSLFGVHRLLMLTFCPVIGSENLQVNHKNGEKLDNRLENLEWCTHKENLRHAWDNGLRPRPDHSILTEIEVHKIREEWATRNRRTQKEIGRAYGVSGSAIYRVVNNKNWKHVC